MGNDFSAPLPFRLHPHTLVSGVGVGMAGVSNICFGSGQGVNSPTNILPMLSGFDTGGGIYSPSSIVSFSVLMMAFLVEVVWYAAWLPLRPGIADSITRGSGVSRSRQLGSRTFSASAPFLIRKGGVKLEGIFEGAESA